MAKGSSKSGFKTFLFLLIAFLGGFVLVIGVILMASPNASIFGLSYKANKSEVLISDIIIGDQTKNLNFSEYDKFVIQAEKSTVSINYGTDNANDSNIIINQNSAGFLKSDSRKDYSYSLTETYSNSKRILTFTLTEPQYDFIQIVNSTKINFNLSVNDVVENKDFEIVTTSGAINIGGATSNSQRPYQIVADSVIATSENGKITVFNSVTVNNTLMLHSKFGNIAVVPEIQADEVSFKTEKSKVDFGNITNPSASVLLSSVSGDITGNNLACNVVVDMKSGILTLGKVDGSISTTNNIESTRFHIYEVIGDVSISNDEGNLSIVLGTVHGDINLSTASGKISVNEIRGQAYIASKSANVNVAVALDNSSTLGITSDSGNVYAHFKSVKGKNTISTNSGKIDVKTDLSTAAYILNAKSEKGSITKVWEDVTTQGEEIVDYGVGSQPLYTDKLILNSTSGNISIDR